MRAPVAALAILAGALLGCAVVPGVAGDDSLDPWSYFPENNDPTMGGAFYVTGRRRRIIRDGSAEKYANYTRATTGVDIATGGSSGVTHACLVDPFAGTVNRFLDGRKGGAGRNVPTTAGGGGSESEEGEDYGAWACRQAYGSVLANYTGVALGGEAVARLLAHIPTEVPSLAILADPASFRVVSASKLDLRFSDDGGVTHLAVEMATRAERFVAPVVLGVMFFLEVEVFHAHPRSVTVHKVGVSLTRTRALTVFAHLASTAAQQQAHDEASCSALRDGDSGSSGGGGTVKAAVAGGEKAAAAAAAAAAHEAVFLQPVDASRPVKVMTYNVWNVNPPHWVYKDAAERWDRYAQRIDHLAKVIIAAGADVVALQEVRHDDNFGPAGGDTSSAKGGAGVAKGTSKGANQMRHLADRLVAHGYAFYAYHPAMSYFSPPGQGSFAPLGGLLREEEGPGFLSRLPIEAVDHLLLPRNSRDGDDGHSRAVLHARLTVPWWPPVAPSGVGSGGSTRGSLDVYSVHLSLSQAARDRAAPLLVEYAGRGRGHAQVLMGDLNAEPDEPAMAFLRGEGPLRRPLRASTKAAAASDDDDDAAFFADAWLALHPEPLPSSTDPWEIGHALTFPACNPIKRIDYVLFRPSTKGEGKTGQGSASAATGVGPSSRWVLEVASVEVVGQSPSDIGYVAREGLGMLDSDSPIWASDHRAVVATLRLVPAP